MVVDSLDGSFSVLQEDWLLKVVELERAREPEDEWLVLVTVTSAVLWGTASASSLDSGKSER